MTTTRFAIAAVATALMGSSALAADLGGNCCADLEERIAELEATTVRKGTRKVSLTLSGYVSHQVMYWDDGTQKDFYIGDGGAMGSRWRFVGSAKISHQLTAGFLYEFQALNTAIGAMNQLNGGNFGGFTGAPANSTLAYAGCAGAAAYVSAVNASSANSVGCPSIRDTTVWLRHAQLGMVKVGHGSTATDNLILIDLGGTSGTVGASPDVALFNGGFILRGKNGQFGGASSFNWTSAIRGHESFDTFRREHVLYETPSLMGFTLQAAVANDNFWDIAMRYAGEFNGVRIAGGLGYQEDTNFNAAFQLFNQQGALCTQNCDVKSKELKLAGSALHVPTGLYLTGAWGNRELSGTQNGTQATQYTGPDLRFWYLNAGISKNFFGLGNTIGWGEYSEHQGGLAQTAFLAGNQAVGAAGNGFCTTLNGVNSNGNSSCDNKVTVWGLGVQQNIDAAAMSVFATYKVYSNNTQGFSGTSANLNATNDFKLFIIGTKIDF